MKTLLSILRFETMIAPLVLQVMFWAGIGGTVYGTYALIKLGNWAWPLAFLFGTLTTRVGFEGAILAFRAYDRLNQIAHAVGTDKSVSSSID